MTLAEIKTNLPNMQTLSNIQKYLYYQFNIFDENLFLSTGTDYQEPVHELRVAVKRIRAIYFLWAFHFPDKAKKSKFPLLLTRIFKKAGKVRDINIQQSLIKQYLTTEFDIEFYSLYLNYRENIEFNEYSHFVRFLSIDAVNEARKALYKMATKLSSGIKYEHNVRIFLETKLADILKTARHLNSDEQVHEIRHNLKISYYMNELLMTEIPDEPIFFQFQKKLKELGDKAGQWHDRFVFIQNTEQIIALLPKEHKKLHKALQKVIKTNKVENEKSLEIFLKNTQGEIKSFLSVINNL